MNLQSSEEQQGMKMSLTRSQELIWLGQQMSPKSPMYNMAIAFELPIALDVVKFRKAFYLLLQACDSMRAVYVNESGHPRQTFKTDFDYEMEFLDFSRETGNFENWKNERSQQLFNIESCLFDSVLIKLDTEKYVWFFNQHHLITDAWAMTRQYQQLAILYKSLLADEETEIPTIPQYKDYVKFEQAQIASEKNVKAVEHWKSKEKTMPVPPDFFGNRNLSQTSESLRSSILLSPEKSNQLRAMTSEADLRSWSQHLSLFTIFSTLLYSLIYRLTAQEKLAIGSPAHNRTTVDFKATPGMFIELFPLHAQIDPDDSFSGLLQKVRIEANNFLKHARTGSSNPNLNRGFNVILNYINASFGDFNGTPVRSEWVHADHADPGHHLRLQVHDFDASGSIELCFDLNTAIFNKQQREALPQQFAQLLNAFIDDRFQPIGQPPLNQESRAIPAFQPAVANMDLQKNVLDLIANHGDSLDTAINYSEGSLSYSELDQHANQLANYLIKNGLQPQDRVAIYLQRSPEFVIAMLATLKAGATFIPLPINYPSGRVLGIVEDAQAKFILSNSVLSTAIPKKFSNLIALDKESAFINQQDSTSPNLEFSPSDLAYILYTSGSTGLPKGVMISHAALSNYIQWAAKTYVPNDRLIAPLFTSVGFDLTITSLFLPICTGGELITYTESQNAPDLALLQVMDDNKVNFIKLTPTHLTMLKDGSYTDSNIGCMIVGGENFSSEAANFVTQNFKAGINIYNEYGPTEATVGCVVHQYNSDRDRSFTSVPIGLPIANTEVYILDQYKNPVPDGVIGELFIGGTGLADGYWQQPQLSAERFIKSPFDVKERIYSSGDLVRWHSNGFLEYHGRQDLQIKIRGRRVELAEIENGLLQHATVNQAFVEMRQKHKTINPGEVHNCEKCGLPSNYPTATFDDVGVCNLCQSFDAYQAKVKKYFKTEDDLRALFTELPENQERQYDCLVLLSGGKDSSYALAKMQELGLNILAFTLDNGYISEEAKDNVRRVVKQLGVDHVFGETEAMNAIFVDSLQRHCNVCDGCFKTIYTLSIKLALQKNIPFIVTGLSRGQFFETRLTEELFRQEEVDVDKIDEIILNARKEYHKVDDAVNQLLDTSMFADEAVFEKVRFIDYYRYTDVSLAQMLEYLGTKVPWVRPSDTGRSTNCLINQAGIYVHKKEKGYSNYAFPYSWDVRVGHKTVEASLDEINEAIDEIEVDKILTEIGYKKAVEEDKKQDQLVAYYSATDSVTEVELRSFLLERLPDYMVPVQFIKLVSFPLTVNGKIDRDALPAPDTIRPVMEVAYEAPGTEFEEMIAEIWSEVLQIDKIGVRDMFLDLGGDSLSGIRIMARINEALELELPVNLIFQHPSITKLSAHVEQTIRTLMQTINEPETS